MTPKTISGGGLNNIPVSGCEGCRTTSGRLGCYQHGQVTFFYTYREKTDNKEDNDYFLAKTLD